MRPATALLPNHLLRSDVHTLFDRGYLTVTPALRVRVSERLKKDFDNGEHYYEPCLPLMSPAHLFNDRLLRGCPLRPSCSRTAGWTRGAWAAGILRCLLERYE